jgi:hypothetical protein
MWRTSKGERVLRGAEWELFREALAGVWDLVEHASDSGEPFPSGVDVFDALQPGQQLALLAAVGRALSDEAVPAPELTALHEGTVAAVFNHARQTAVEQAGNPGEPDGVETATSWRGLVLAACREALGESESPLPTASSDDAEAWALLVDCLADQVLWDADYEMGDEFLDSAPEVSRALLEKMRIPGDYFLTLAPDPTHEDLEGIRRTLGELTGQAGPDGATLLPGVLDDYHHLLVGPCDQETVSRETGCRLIQAISVAREDDFDCSYRQWVDLFRGQVLTAAAQEPVRETDPTSVLSPGHRAEAERAQRDGSPLVLADGNRVELRGGGWIVVDGRGDALADAEGAAWTLDEDEDVPPLAFATAGEALAALLHAQALETARAERRQLALRALGREEQ